MSEAEALVGANRTAVAVVVDELVAQHVLSGDEVAAIATAYPARVRVKAVRLRDPI